MRLGLAHALIGSGCGPPAAPYDFNHYVWVGQSLSAGYGSAALSTAQSYTNVRLDDAGPSPKYPPGLVGSVLSLQPLTEPLRPATLAGATTAPDYPNNCGGVNGSTAPFGESPATAFGNQLSWLAAQRGGTHRSAASLTGVGGASIAQIGKGGQYRAYQAGLDEVTAVRALVAAGQTHGVPLVPMVHAETGFASGTYGTDLLALQANYDADLRAITGQAKAIPILTSQSSALAGGDAGAWVSLLAASVANPSRIVLAGPKYAYDYASDHLHMPAWSYRRLAIWYARIADLVERGASWSPLRPIAFTRVAADTIEVQFAVPVAPLEWDASIAAPHQSVNTAWANGRGFELRDSLNAAITIDTVTITASDRVQVKATATLPANTRVAYAITADAAGQQGGTANAPRGQLRDGETGEGYDAVDILCNVVNGSAAVSCVTPGSFAGHGPRDNASAAGLATGTVLVTQSGNSATLSAPWTGATGQASIHVAHDMHNYAVHFSQLVPLGGRHGCKKIDQEACEVRGKEGRRSSPR